MIVHFVDIGGIVNHHCLMVRGVASLEGDNLVILYYFSVSEIWPD